MAKYIVNHGGVVHSVNDEEFAVHLGMASKKPTEADPAGKPAREATPEEVAAYFKRQGLQLLPDGGVRRLADGFVWDSVLDAFVSPDEASAVSVVPPAPATPAASSADESASAGASDAPDKGAAKSDSKASSK